MINPKYFLLLGVLLNNCCCAQFFRFSYPTDTLAFSALAKGKRIYSLKSVKGDIIDSLIKPSALLFKYKSDSIVTQYLIAVKTNKSYVLHPLFISMNYGKDSLVKQGMPYNLLRYRRGNVRQSSVTEIKKYKFNHTTDSFLIIHFSRYELISNGSGFEKQEQGYLICNLNTSQVLELITYRWAENWPYGDGSVATNSGMVWKGEYKLLFENGQLVIWVDEKEKRYTYQNGLFVKEK